MKADKTLDIKGLSDQRPQEVTKDVLNMMAEGQILRVIADDAGARQAIAAPCECSGYNLLSMEEDRGIICFNIQK
jgi:tRNA 2-thiouridine synthesizing protein A